jgi:acyl carrier protein
MKKIQELSKKENITEDMVFGSDIVLDSLDVGELMMFIKNNYSQYKEMPILEIKTVKDIIRIA